jgi:hypothetical protein
MDAITYRARQVPSGIPGMLSLEACELEKELGEWLREQHRYAKAKQEKEPLYELEFEVTIKRWYRRRSLQANNLAWELATRLAQADAVSKELVYYAVKELVDLPRDEYRGIYVQRASGQLNTVEFARFIERLVIECQTHEPAVEIRDIWILFTQWRFGQEVDPLRGTYASKDDYREQHPGCEACGKVLLYIDKEGVQRNAGEVAHIVSEGSGGAEEDWNWLLLCEREHRELQHQQGWDRFIEQHPHLRIKVERARARAGKKPIDRDPEPAPAAAAPEPAAADPAVVAETARGLLKVFQGTIVAGEIPATEPPDEGKQLMLDKLMGLQQQAEERQQKYYGKVDRAPPAELPFDPKTAQYKEDE